MCGICGIASPVGPPDPERLAAMSAALVHRGPDRPAEHLDGPVALAARRLSIIDLAGGDQPIANEDGSCVVVQNGEIYNSPELRRELERAGHRFQHALRHRGARPSLRGARPRLRAPAPRHVRGRDLGRAPAPARARRATGSASSRSTTATSAASSRSRRSCARCRAARSTSTRSRRSSPSTRSRRRTRSSARSASSRPGTCSSGRATARILVDRYARPAPAAIDELRNDDEAELLEELRARLRDSVRAHLLSDVPVGVLLSGGVDSAALAALAAQESGDPVHTFTIGFAERSFDERDDARLVAERYGTDHHELLVKPDPTLLLPALADAFDEPFADSSALPTYLVSAAGGAPREGRALRRGRRRAVRRLLHVRGRPPRRPVRSAGAARAAGGRAPADVDLEGELRLQGEALRARGAPAAARAPPRLEGDLLRRRAHRADGTQRDLRSRRRLPRPLSRDRRRRPARATAGRRLRRLPRGRPAREDRPRVDGALAGGARAVPRPGR